MPLRARDLAFVAIAVTCFCILFVEDSGDPIVSLFIIGYITLTLFGVFLALDCIRCVLVRVAGLSRCDPALRLARDLVFSIVLLAAFFARSAFLILALDVRDSVDLALAVSPSGAMQLVEGTLTPDLPLIIAGSLVTFVALVLALRKMLSVLLAGSTRFRWRVLALGVSGCFVLLCLIWQIGLVPVQARASQDFARSYLFQPGFHLLSKSAEAAKGKATAMTATVRAFEPFARLDVPTPVLKSDGPSIVLVISETVRGDAVNERVMPGLSAYRDRTVGFEKVYSSANGTHLSWFALHSGQFPIYWWNQRKETVQPGSPVFQHLKSLGYRFRLYGKADTLGYLDMGRMYFGDGNRLLDHVFEAEGDPAISDRNGTEALARDLQDPELARGTVFLLHLYAPHHHYFFPDGFKGPHADYAPEFDYLKTDYSDDDLRLIRNRYENSLAYVDALMTRLTDVLEASPLHQDTVFAFTGDHGEEFREYGSLIHGSNLEDPQTVVPFILRAPRLGKVRFTGVKSTLQLWPTLLDAAGVPFTPSLFHSGSALNDRNETIVVSKVRTDRFPDVFAVRNGGDHFEVDLGLNFVGIPVDAEILRRAKPETSFAASTSTAPIAADSFKLPECVAPFPGPEDCLIRFAQDDG